MTSETTPKSEKKESGYSLIATDTSQSIAKKQAEMARLRELESKKQTAIKAIIGGNVLAHAVSDINFARELLKALEKTVKNENDLGRINGTMNNLRKKLNIPEVEFVAKEKTKKAKKDSDSTTSNATQSTENKSAITTPLNR